MDALILITCCILFFGIGIGILIRNVNFIKKAVKTEGEIVDVISYTSSQSRTMYTPVIEFCTIKNEVIRIKSSGSSNWKPKIGKKMPVCYLEENPQKAKVATIFYMYGAPGIVIVMGLVLLAVIIMMVG